MVRDSVASGTENIYKLYTDNFSKGSQICMLSLLKLKKRFSNAFGQS